FGWLDRLAPDTIPTDGTMLTTAECITSDRTRGVGPVHHGSTNTGSSTPEKTSGLFRLLSVRGAIPMINEEAAERFMKAPWLAEVERQPKLALLNALAEQKAGAGTVLLKQGQPNDHLTFLIDGKVDLERTFG